MPFDGKNFETKPAVFSLEGLIAWLETQPPETTYRFACTDGSCLLDRYLTAVVGSPPRYPRVPVHERVVGGAPNYTRIAAYEPHTFGAALERARALLA